MKTLKLITLALVVTLAGCSSEPDPLPPFIAKKMFITSVDVTQWPQLDAGVGWDLTSAPDALLSIDDGTTVLFSSLIQENTTQTTLQFTVAKTLTDFAKEHSIGLWDEDSPDDDDLIGFYNFTIDDYYPLKSNPQLTDYPTTIELTTKSNFKLKLNVSWQQ